MGNGHLGAPGWALPGSSGAGAGAGVGLSAWQTSAKIEFLLRLLGELRDRNVAAAQRCGAGPQLMCVCDVFRVFRLCLRASLWPWLSVEGGGVESACNGGCGRSSTLSLSLVSPVTTALTHS